MIKDATEPDGQWASFSSCPYSSPSSSLFSSNSLLPMSHGTIEVGSLELGFRIVHRPESPTADLIFIHGLNGHRSITWTNRSGEFWLPWLGKHLPDVRVWTYGYEADQIFDSREGLENSREALDSHATQFLLKLSSCLLVRILF